MSEHPQHDVPMLRLPNSITFDQLDDVSRNASHIPFALANGIITEISYAFVILSEHHIPLHIVLT